MKKLTLVAAAMMVSLTGCQTCNTLTQRVVGHFRGSLSGLGNCGLNGGGCRMGASNVGAPCDAGCESGYAPAADHCDPCAQSAGYGGYGDAGGEYGSVVTGTYEGVPSGATITSPSTIVPSTGTTTTIPSGSYLSSPTPAPLRGESVLPRTSN